MGKKSRPKCAYDDSLKDDANHISNTVGRTMHLGQEQYQKLTVVGENILKQKRQKKEEKDRIKQRNKAKDVKVQTSRSSTERNELSNELSDLNLLVC